MMKFFFLVSVSAVIRLGDTEHSEKDKLACNEGNKQGMLPHTFHLKECESGTRNFYEFDFYWVIGINSP